MTAVVIDGPNGKEYRLPTDEERAATERAEAELDALYDEIPFGLPTEPTPKSGKGASRHSRSMDTASTSGTRCSRPANCWRSGRS